MIKDKEVTGGISQAVDILKTERNRIQHVIDLLEGTATIREVNNGESKDAKETHTRKKRTPPVTKLKRTYIVRQTHIRAVLEGVDESISVYSIVRQLLETFNVSATEAAVKKVLKVDAGRTFRESGDGLWKLVE